MQWSAESAMHAMWDEMDKNVSNGEMMRFFARHLQAAYDRGRGDALDQLDSALPLTDAQLAAIGDAS